MWPAPLPGKSGEDLVSNLYNLREAEPDRFEAIQDALKSAFPTFQRLDFPTVAAGTIAMLWRDSEFSKPLYMHQISEGMLLRGRDPDADHVIALTDVYTGSNDFHNAEDAKQKMRHWVGPNDRFHPHVAQHDFEAWLPPYWSTIQELAKHNRKAPAGNPESVNHNHPPSYHIKEIFRAGQGPMHYTKARDAKRILHGQDLSIAAAACPELQSFLNTILKLCGGELI